MAEFVKMEHEVVSPSKSPENKEILIEEKSPEINTDKNKDLNTAGLRLSISPPSRKSSAKRANNK